MTYRPGADALEIFLASTWPIFQLAVFGVLLAADWIAGHGRARVSGHPLLVSRAGALSPLFLLYLGVMLFFSYVPAQPRQYQHDMASDFLALMIAIFVWAVFPVYIIRNAWPFMKGWDYLFVEHPADPIARPSLKDGTAINANRLADSLSGGMGQNAPTYHFDNQATKAESLARDIEQDAEVAEARARRARAQAEFEAAERELDEAKRRGTR